MADQYTVKNPVDMYPTPPFEKQPQSVPGLAQEMNPKPDHGEETYRGDGRLKGRKAIITGADSGIGRATAIAYAREGADILMSYLESETPDANETAQYIKDAGQQAIMCPGDISEESTIEMIVNTAVKEWGQIDILVNNAGRQQNIPLAELTWDEIDATFKTNVYATMIFTKLSVPHMKPGASIINLTSIQAYTPSPTLPHYAATKAAINNFTKGQAQELAEKGIRCNAVAPGPVWTPLQTSGGQPQDKIEVFGQEETPIGRGAQPAELAPPMVFLASMESSYVSGETLNVNGGMPTP